MKDFEKKIAQLRALQKLSKSEEKYLADIDSKISELDAEYQKAVARKSELDSLIAQRWTGKLTEAEQIEYDGLAKTLRDIPPKVKTLTQGKRFFMDSYQALLSKKQSAIAKVKMAKDAVIEAERKVSLAEERFDYDAVETAKRAVMSAKESVKRAEDEYAGVVDELMIYEPPYQKFADTLRKSIKEDAESRIAEHLKAIVSICDEAVSEMEELHREEDRFDITGENKSFASLRYRTDCGWFNSMKQSAESEMPRKGE